MSKADQRHAPVDLKRRKLISSAFQMGTASVGAAAPSGCGSSVAANSPTGSTGTDGTPMPSGNFRIDVHCHHIPDFYRLSLASKGVLTAGGIPVPPPGNRLSGYRNKISGLERRFG